MQRERRTFIEDFRRQMVQLYENGKAINHKRVERLMRLAGLRSKVSKKYKATTQSSHQLPLTVNRLNTRFVTREQARAAAIS